MDKDSEVLESEGGIDLTDVHQFLTRKEFVEPVSDTFNSLDLGVTEEALDDVEGVNATLVGPSLGINDAGMVVSGDMAFATIADTDLVN